MIKPPIVPWSRYYETNKEMMLVKARRAGVRVEPYTIEDVKKFEQKDLDRIRLSKKSIEDGQWDIKELSYFRSPKSTQLGIDNWKIVKKLSYKEAKMQGLESAYLDYHMNGKKTSVQFADDFEDYKEECCLYNYEQAVRLGKEEEYFSGIRIFPECKSDRRVMYAGDYDAYIRSLSLSAVFDLICRYRRSIPPRDQVYDNPVSFVDTFLYQVNKYITVLKNMPEPIYIPGDGFGSGAYVCALLGKKCIATDPNDICYEFRVKGMMLQESFSINRARECASVFVGNMINYLCEEDYQNLCDMNFVVQWDEVPRLESRRWINLGDVRAWSTIAMTSMFKESKVYYEKTLFELSKRFVLETNDPLSVAVCKKNNIRINVVDEPSILVWGAETVIGELSESSNAMERFEKEKEKVKREQDNKKPEIVMKERLWITSKVKAGYPSYDIFTRGFSRDLKHARPRVKKDIDGDLIEWYPDEDYVVDGYYGKIDMTSYDDNVLRSYKWDGTFFTATVRLPRRKIYALMSDGVKYRIALRTFNDQTKCATYMLASDFAYHEEKSNNIV